MRNVRFTEHKIIAVLKSSKPDVPLRMFAVKPVSLKPQTTTGKQSMAVWKSPISKR